MQGELYRKAYYVDEGWVELIHDIYTYELGSFRRIKTFGPYYEIEKARAKIQKRDKKRKKQMQSDAKGLRAKLGLPDSLDFDFHYKIREEFEPVEL
jgi:hypothetical protein